VLNCLRSWRMIPKSLPRQLSTRLQN